MTPARFTDICSRPYDGSAFSGRRHSALEPLNIWDDGDSTTRQ